MDVTNCSKNDLVDMILKDAWYHIYENVYFLDVRYNINNDVVECYTLSTVDKRTKF